MPATDNSLSIAHLILNASFLVQVVMLILVLASVISWAMIFQRERYQRKASGAFNYFEKQFWSGIDLNQLYRQTTVVMKWWKVLKVFSALVLKNLLVYVRPQVQIRMR